jgi:L-rhamnose mutarotase
MKRVGSLIKLRPEYEERYIILHKHVFPEVLDRIRKSNVRNYSIFLKDGILFSYFEYIGSDYTFDTNEIADAPTKEWWKLTDPMQEPLPDRKEGEWWTQMKLIQHFDQTTKPYSQAKRFSYTGEVKKGYEGKIKKLLDELNNELPISFKEANIQNHSTFLKEGKLYVYFEHTGSNFIDDDKKLNRKREFIKWNNNMEQCLGVAWQEMKEVFHTN